MFSQLVGTIFYLVENAFKHGSNKHGVIDIDIKLDGQALQFEISNTKELNKSQGINGFEEGAGAEVGLHD